MNMLNKYSYFFWGDNGTQCETLIQPHLNRKFIPPLRKENPFQLTAVLCRVKSGQQNLEAIISSFQCIHPFFHFARKPWECNLLIWQHINQETMHILHTHTCTHIYTFIDTHMYMYMCAYSRPQNQFLFAKHNTREFSLFQLFSVCLNSRLWRGPCRGHANATGCRGAAPHRPAGCSCQSSERWGTTWRRSTTELWRWISSVEQGTVRPAEEPSLRPLAPSHAKSWFTSKTPPITA